MATITMIAHMAGVPALILASATALRSVLRVVLAAAATFGHGAVASRAEAVLRILCGQGSRASS